MNTDKILPVAKRHLLLANAIVWGAPGVKILVTGIASSEAGAEGAETAAQEHGGHEDGV